MASEEEDTDPESEKEEQEQPRRSRRIQSQIDTDEKAMRTRKKLNVSHNPMMSGIVFADDLVMVAGTDEPNDNPEISGGVEPPW